MRSLAPRQSIVTSPAAASCLYVIDASLRLILTGPSPLELNEPPAAQVHLPRDFTAPLAEILAQHDFDRQPIARATLADVALRCMRAPGESGTYYMVVARALPDVFRAVA